MYILKINGEIKAKAPGSQINQDLYTALFRDYAENITLELLDKDGQLVRTHTINTVEA